MSLRLSPHLLPSAARVCAWALCGFLSTYVFARWYADAGHAPAVAASNSGARSHIANDTPTETLRPGMRWIASTEFWMGSDDSQASPCEAPAHRVQVTGFWIDETEVTNSQFAQFVASTNYQTTAERTLQWESLQTQLPPGTPKPPDNMLQPGSLVFTPPTERVSLANSSNYSRSQLAAPRRPTEQS